MRWEIVVIYIMNFDHAFYLFCPLSRKLESVRRRLWWKPYHDDIFLLPETWKRHAVLIDLQDGSPNSKISKSQYEVRAIYSKRVDESNGDYKGTTWKTHSLVLIRKNIIGEIKSMMDNKPINSIHTQGHRRVDFLIKQVVDKDTNFFFYRRWKAANFYHIT